MTIADHDTKDKTRPGWNTVELRGGPADRQFRNFHRLETYVDVAVGSATHRYHRIGLDSIAYHETLLAGMFKGGGRSMR